MTTLPAGTVCGLCGLPPYVGLNGEWFGGAADGVHLHRGTQMTQQVDCRHDDVDGCTPIYTTCFRAWTVYGLRPSEDT